MSGGQVDSLFAATPIVLDLDGHGIQTRSAAEGVQFDLNGTGTTQQWGWVGGGDGLLVRDLNGNGLIDGGQELFGSGTVLANGQRAGNGYLAMLALDDNHDGRLSAADAAFKQLQVWVDGNHNGVTDAGELKNLADLHIVSLDLNAQKGDASDHGNLLGLTSSFTTSDGTQHDMADVWFAKQQAEPAALPAASELLSAPATDLLGGLGSSATTVAADTTAAVQAHHRLNWKQRELDDDAGWTPLI
jgi:hypothetical protein